MTTYLITTAVTAYQTYTVEAEDEQAARDKVIAALGGKGDYDESHKILMSAHDDGFNDDEQLIDSKKLVSA